MIRSLEKFSFRSSLKNLLFIFVSYYILIWMTHLILVSGISFFHFLLDHRLGTIEDWLFDRGWYLVVICKVLSLYIILKLIFVNSSEREPFLKFLKAKFIRPGKKVLIGFVTFFILVLLSCQSVRFERNDFEVFRFIQSYLGCIAFFMTDIVLLKIWEDQIGIKIKKPLVYFFICSLIFFFMSKNTFLYERNISPVIILLYLFNIYLSIYKAHNWSIVGSFIAFIIAPLYAITNFNLIWDDHHALIVITDPLKKFILFNMSIDCLSLPFSQL